MIAIIFGNMDQVTQMDMASFAQVPATPYRAQPRPIGDAVAQRVQRALATSQYIGLHNIRCEMIDRDVVLQGRVATFHLKQVAQETARKLGHGTTIRNEIEVTS